MTAATRGQPGLHLGNPLPGLLQLRPHLPQGVLGIRQLLAQRHHQCREHLIRRRTLLTEHTRTLLPGARRRSQEIKKPEAASPQGHHLRESAVDFEAG